MAFGFEEGIGIKGADDGIYGVQWLRTRYVSSFCLSSRTGGKEEGGEGGAMTTDHNMN